MIFCWVLHRDDIYAQILTRLFPGGPPPEIRVVRVSLLCSEGTLRERLGREIAAGLRTPDVLERSAARLPLYAGLDTEKLMTDGLTPEETAARLEALLERAERT